MTESGHSDTIFDELSQSDQSTLAAMLSLSEKEQMDLIESRRHEIFSVLWKHGDMGKEEVLDIVKKNEEIGVEEINAITDHIPDWLGRLEAQDQLAIEVFEKYETKNP